MLSQVTRKDIDKLAADIFQDTKFAVGTVTYPNGSGMPTIVKIGKYVICNIGVYGMSNVAYTAALATLPTGFRPKSNLAVTMNIRTESATPHISAGIGAIYTNGEVKQAHAGSGNLIDAFTLSCIFETD